MCCFFTVLLFFGPRLANIVWWFWQPLRWSAAFDEGILLPILGIIFLPWTTLFYVTVGFNGVTGIEWLFVILGFIFDIGSYSGGGYGNRDRLRYR